MRKSPADIRSKFPTEQAAAASASALIPPVTEEIRLTMTAAEIQGDPGTLQTGLLQRLEENRGKIEGAPGNRLCSSGEGFDRLQNFESHRISGSPDSW